MKVTDEYFDKSIKEGGFALEDLICDLLDDVPIQNSQSEAPKPNAYELYRAFRKQKLLLAGLIELLDKKGVLRQPEIRKLLEDLRD